MRGRYRATICAKRSHRILQQSKLRSLSTVETVAIATRHSRATCWPIYRRMHRWQSQVYRYTSFSREKIQLL